MTTLVHLLSAARRRTQRARLRAAALLAGERAAAALTVLAGGYALVRILGLLAGVPAVLGGYLYLLVLLGAVVVVFAVTLTPIMLRRPPIREAAERLDLGTADHNRIAIALALGDRNGADPFAAAAIQDGLRHLQRLHDRRPHVERVTPRWRSTLLFGALFLALNTVTLLCTAAPPAAAAYTLDIPFATQRPLSARAATNDADARESRENRREYTPRRTVAGHQTSRAPAAAGASPGTSPAGAVAASPGEGQGADAGHRQRGVGGGGVSGVVSAAAAAGKQAEPKPSGARPIEPDRMPEVASKRHQEGSSSISPGASGGAGITPVTHDWAQQETSLDDQADEATNERVEDEQRSNTQRGGLQPLLKDRREAPSRELGLSGASDGPPGTGRGGPTPPKKSRGTASLVLGVPVPDFVKGRLGPGTTKVVQERIAPLANIGERTPPVPALPRSVPEASIPRFDVPGRFVDLVREYLIALHAAGRQHETPTPDAGAIPKPERSETEP